MAILSLVPRPEEEEEKGPGFSHSRMHLLSQLPPRVDQWEGANDAFEATLLIV